MSENDNLTVDEIDMIRSGLGLDYKRHPYRNRIACHEARPRMVIARRLFDLGLIAPDYMADYGRMRVFRVTEAGFHAVGIVRPKKGLLDLVPKVSAPLPLAA